MPKNKFDKTSSLLIKMLIVDLVTTFSLLFVLSSISSLLFLKTDTELSFIKYFTFVIVVITAFLTSFFVVNVVKSNALLFGVISQIPLIIFMASEFAINHNSLYSFLIKLLLSVIFGVIGGFIATKNKRKIKVK